MISTMGIFSYFTTTAFAADSGIKVKVSTYIPGAWCTPPKNGAGKSCDINKDQWCFIECTVQPWFKQVSVMFGYMIKYATFLASLWAVLFIVISGIGYTMSGASGEGGEEAKKHIKQAFIWLAVLLLSWYILYIIAPWIYTG